MKDLGFSCYNFSLRSLQCTLVGTLSSFWMLGEEKQFPQSCQYSCIRRLTVDTENRLPEIRGAVEARLRKAGGVNRKVYYIQTMTYYALCTYT
jgi:hypothetical protein